MSEVSVGMLDDFPTDAGRKVEVDGQAVAVFRLGDDVHAIANRCSHEEASLADGDLFDTEVECPKHGAAFDIVTGRALTLPATKPVAVYSAHVRDGELFIELPQGGPADE